MKAFAAAVLACAIISIVANAALTRYLDFSSANVYRSESVRLGQ